jgi:hypothetical protein
MTRSERILAWLGLVGIIKPCCLIFWTAMFFGSTSTLFGISLGWVANMMQYEKYFVLLTIGGIAVAQYHIWTALVRRLRNPRKTPWKNWLVKFTTIQVYTVVCAILGYFHPGILPWYMGN